MFNKILLGAFAFLTLLLPAVAFAQLSTFQGGTGTTSPSGILIGDKTIRLKTLTVGSGLTLTGTTLTASGGSSASSTLLGDTNTFSGFDTFSNTITGSISGNAGTVTNGVVTTGTYLNPAWITGIPYSILTGTIPTWNQNTTGSAATLTTSRTINGVGFNGSANITINAASSTLLGDTQLFTGVDKFTNASSDFSGTWQTLSPSHFQVAGSYLTSAITGLAQTYGSTQTGATQTLATSSDTNIGITITNPSSNNFTFTPTWIGTLADARISSAATWNAKLSTVTADAPLSGSGTSGSHLTISTAGTWSGNAGTATALAANGTNCSAGNYPLGVDASGNAESCTAAAVGTVTSIATNNGLTGGTITTTGTIGLAAIAANSVLGNSTGASAVPSAVATSSLFTLGAGLVSSTNLLQQVEHPSFQYSTSTAWTGTTTIFLQLGYGEVFNSVRCATDVGTLGVDFYHASSHLNYITTASTTANVNVFSSNNTITAGDLTKVDIGTAASSPTKIICTIKDTI